MKGLSTETAGRTRNLARLGQILMAAARHGWAHYLDRSGLERQLLSVRQELLSDAVIRELQKLQDAVPPFPGSEARAIVEAELGRSVAELFASFDDTPFAAASIGQVHHAALPDGTAVIVKVIRPGIEALVEADVEILFFLARLLRDHVPESRRYDPPALVEEFTATITLELDLRLEGRNADRFRQNFRDDPAVYVPEVFRDATARRVLTMACSTGRRANEGYPANPEERRRLARELARLFLAQLFEHGFFHGDPHPGNVFVLEDGRLCFHDFGIVGRLAPRDQEHVRQLFLTLVARDSEWIADVYFDMGVAAAEVDRPRDLDESLEYYYAVATRSYSFAAILNQFIRIGQRHEIRAPRELLLVAKAFMAVESQLHVLDPEFNIIAAWQAYVPEMVKRQLLPGASATEWLAPGYRHAALLKGAAASLPNILVKALALLQSGEAGARSSTPWRWRLFLPKKTLCGRWWR
jgi:ubiquinone biosynthesis protein